MSDPQPMREATSQERVDMNLEAAEIELRNALTMLRSAQRLMARSDFRGRDVSIALHHVEDALLRLQHGSPPDL